MPRSAQSVREFLDKTVDGVDLLRLHDFDEAQEIRVIGVIAERKGGVALVTIDRRWIHRPTGDRRRAPAA